MAEMEFKISTGLKSIIGKELITEAHTAVFELVKNAYDASATRVDIVFQDIKRADGQNRGKILIVDNGEGMSYEDIDKKWLFVGYSKKKPEAGKDDFRDKAANKNRMMAGSKGIGRFSADRLGRNLNLYTKTRSAATVHHVKMDWGNFEGNQDKEFQTVKVEYEELDKFPEAVTRGLDPGTVLEICPLEDKWDRTRLLKLKKYLQRLVNPVQISRGEKFEIHMAANEFLESDKELEKKDRPHETINGKVDNEVFKKIGTKTTQITCNISESKITTQITDKGRFVFKTEEANEHKEYLSDINIVVFYLNPEAKKTFTRNMGMPPVQFGSIFLYKNGFRIHPYGEEKDDWLSLEQRKGQGYSRYLATRELIGRVEINRNQRGFREVSSRHGGVVETEEHRKLVKFMGRRVIRWLERYVVEGLDWDRSKDKARKSPESIKEDSINVLGKFTDQIKDLNKRITFDENLMDILKEKRVGDIPEIVKSLSTLASHVESEADKTRIKGDIALLVGMTKQQSDVAATKAYKAKEEEVLFWKKSRLKDSKLAADYNHWIVISTDYIRGYLHDLIDAIRENKLEDMMPLVESISRENQRIATVASIVSKANFDVQSPRATADLVSYIVQYVEQVLTSPSKKIRVTFYNKSASIKTKFTPLEVSMMLDNFVSNSKKAYAKNVIIRFLVVKGALHMLVADDGEGIPDERKEQVFERGFTTTDGSGIGLSHIRAMAQKMGGSVIFLGNDIKGLASGACFEVIFNVAR